MAWSNVRTRTHLTTLLLMLVASATYASVFEERYVNTTRAMDDIQMTVAFSLLGFPYRTQFISCPGAIMGFEHSKDLNGNVVIEDNKGREMIYDLLEGKIRAGDETTARIAADPMAESYRFYGPPAGIIIRCGPVLSPPEFYPREEFYLTDMVEGNGPCVAQSYKDNIATFACGYGYVPPYGCFDYKETKRRVCYEARLAHWKNFEVAIPGMIAYRKSLWPFKNDEKFKGYIAKLNSLAANGDPYGERANAEYAAKVEQRAQEQAAIDAERRRNAPVSYRKISKDDQRLPKNYEFTDIERVRTPDNRVIVAVTPPSGNWSIPIRCPDNDTPLGYKAKGNGVFRMPGGATYIEYGHDFPNEFPNGVSSWGVLFGERDFYATSFSSDSHFEIYCPPATVVSTRFEYIEHYNNDNTLPLPGCSINGGVETCRVVHPNLVHELSKRNWQFYVDVSSHIREVQRYNAKVKEDLQAKEWAETKKKATAMNPLFWLLGIILAVCIVIFVISNWR